MAATAPAPALQACSPLHQAAAETAKLAAKAQIDIERLGQAAGCATGPPDALLTEKASPDEDVLRYIAKLYGIPTRHRQLKYMTANLVDELLDDISRIKPEANRTVRIFADQQDYHAWSKAGIIPRSAYHEANATLCLEGDPAATAGQVERQLLRCRLAGVFSGMLICDIVAAVLDGKDAPTPASGLPAAARSAIAEVNAAIAATVATGL